MTTEERVDKLEEELAAMRQRVRTQDLAGPAPRRTGSGQQVSDVRYVTWLTHRTDWNPMADEKNIE